MTQIEARIRALLERLARENQRLLALLRAGRTLAEAERVLKAEARPPDTGDGRVEEDAKE